MTTSPPNNKSLQPSSPVTEHRFKIHCLGGFPAHIPPAPKQSWAWVSYSCGKYVSALSGLWRHTTVISETNKKCHLQIPFFLVHLSNSWQTLKTIWGWFQRLSFGNHELLEGKQGRSHIAIHIINKKKTSMAGIQRLCSELRVWTSHIHLPNEKEELNFHNP